MDATTSIKKFQLASLMAKWANFCKDDLFKINSCLAYFLFSILPNFVCSGEHSSSFNGLSPKMLKTPYFFGSKTEFFSFPNTPKNLAPSYKMDLDLRDCLGRVRLVLQQNFLRLIHSRERKILSFIWKKYSRHCCSHISSVVHQSVTAPVQPSFLWSSLICVYTDACLQTKNKLFTWFPAATNKESPVCVLKPDSNPLLSDRWSFELRWFWWN